MAVSVHRAHLCCEAVAFGIVVYDVHAAQSVAGPMRTGRDPPCVMDTGVTGRGRALTDVADQGGDALGLGRPEWQQQGDRDRSRRALSGCGPTRPGRWRPGPPRLRRRRPRRANSAAAEQETYWRRESGHRGRRRRVVWKERDSRPGGAAGGQAVRGGQPCSLALKTLGKMVSVRRSRPRPSGVLVIAMSPSLVLLRFPRADLALDNCSYRE